MSIVSPPSGSGLYMFQRDYGSLDKCPYCSAENIPRLAKCQLTCGKLTCRALSRTQRRKEKEARIRTAKKASRG